MNTVHPSPSPRFEPGSWWPLKANESPELNGFPERGQAADQHSPIGASLAQLMEQFYLDLPICRNRSGFDPAVALENSRQTDDIQDVFRTLRDRHTFVAFGRGSASPPSHHQGPSRPQCLATADPEAVVELPLQLERSADSLGQRFWVKTVTPACPKQLEPGTEVTHWNGVPVALAASSQGHWHRGAHRDARNALGLRSLTQRLLGTVALPTEDWVTLTCKRGRASFEVRVDWQQNGAPAIPSSPLPTAKNHHWRQPLSNTSSGDGFRCGLLKACQGSEPAAAYLRLFWLPEADALTDLGDCLQRLSGSNEPRPLVLDLRSNGGGSVTSAQQLARWIVGSNVALPQVRFQFRDTPAIRRMLTSHQRWRPWARPWAQQVGVPVGCRVERRCPSSDLLEERVFSGHVPRYLSPQPLESDQAQSKVALNPESTHHGFARVVVLVDALTYSAAEILVALLRTAQRPHQAVVLGPDFSTGCGTANAWSYQTLRRLHPDRQLRIGNGTAGQSANAANLAVVRFAQLGQSEVLSQANLGSSHGRRWTLRRSNGSIDTVTLAPDLGDDVLNVYLSSPLASPVSALESSQSAAREFNLDPLPKLPRSVDLQLAIRRPLLHAGDTWIPIGGQSVDARVPITKRDLFEGNRDLLKIAADTACSSAIPRTSTNKRSDPSIGS